MDYGLALIAGDMGAGKTFNVYQEAFMRKLNNPYGILIANIPYDFVDVHYSKRSDLDDILLFLANYIIDTNDIDSLKNADFPLIKLVIDEAHIYFPAREFTSFSKDFMLILTQCRKRNIQIDIISQRLGQIDVFIRRLCGLCTWYDSLRFGFRRITYYDIGDGDKINRNEWEVILKDLQYPKWFNISVNKQLKHYFDQRYFTNYVVGLDRVFTETLKEQKEKFVFSQAKKDEYEAFRKLLALKSVDETLKIKKDFDDYKDGITFTSKSLES